MDNIIINPDNYLSKNINFGYYDNNGIFIKIKEDNKIKKINNSENTYKVNISYCYKPNIFKPFLFTLGENKIPWYKLTQGYINENKFIRCDPKELKLDIIINDNKYNLVNFKNMVNKIKQNIQLFIENNLNINQEYNIIVKDIINNGYINNVRFKYNYNNMDEKTFKTKILLKINKDNEIITEVINNHERIINKKFYILPVLHLSSLFIKTVNNIINIYPQIYLEQLTLYGDNKLPMDNKIIEFEIDENTYLYNDI
jgi:hypothetical protein